MGETKIDFGDKKIVIDERCRGCLGCTRACPAGAISGMVRHVQEVDNDRCIECGKCLDICLFDAISLK
jgi:Fe-S-cluster-containing hydrogenase component 2